MNGPGAEHPKRSFLLGSLHYANLVALVGLAYSFLWSFIGAGTAQLITYSEYREPSRSLWDLAWESVKSGDVDVSFGAFVACVTLALIVAIVCLGMSWKMRKEGPNTPLLIATFVLAGAGAGILHSYASLVFVIPAVMVVAVFAEMLIKSSFGGTRTMGGKVWQQPGAPVWSGAAAYPPQGAYVPQAAQQPAAPADAAAKAVVPGTCGACGVVNPVGSTFCAGCGGRVQ